LALRGIPKERVLSVISWLTTPDLPKLVIAVIGSAVTGLLTLLAIVIRNWCKLLSGTIAVLHPDEHRRADARRVYQGPHASTSQAELPEQPGLEAAPAPHRRRRRRRRRPRRHSP
jgi:hypothetical protein